MRKTEQNPGTATLIIVAVFLISSVLESLSASAIWAWFLSGYGPGPTLGQWFGISALTAVIVRRVHGKWREPIGEGDVVAMTLGDIVASAVVMWLGLGVLLALAWSVGFLLHWVP